MNKNFLKMLLLIFLISVLPRIVFVGAVSFINGGDISTLIGKDAISYYRTALWLMGEPGYFMDVFSSSVCMLLNAPLYPLVLSIFFKIFRPDYVVAVYLNIAFFGLSACILYIIGNFLFGNRAGFCAAAIFSFYPPLFICSIRPLTESLFLFFFIFAFYNFIIFLKTDKSRFLAFTAFFLGFSALTREVVVFFPITIAIFLGLKYRRYWKQAAKNISLLAIIYTVTLLPFLLYNYQLSSGRSFAISAKMAIYTNFLGGKTGVVKSERKVVVSNDKKISLQKRSSLFLNIADYFYARKRFFMGTGTMGIMKALGYKIPELEGTAERPKLFLASLRKFGWGWVAFQYCALFFVGCVYIFSLFTLFRLIVKRRFKEVVLFLLILLYFLAAHLYDYNSRYFIPMIPFLAILSVYPLRRYAAR